jgi:ABC-type uncharacterized transport system substrate-binding protein
MNRGKEKHMKKKITVLALSVMLFALCVSAEAQQQKIPRIGYLANDSHGPSTEKFRQGLRDFGYIEGQNIFIEWRFAEGKSDRLRELAAELLRLNLDMIVAGASAAVPYLRQNTRTIPIVMAAYSGDPCGRRHRG